MAAPSSALLRRPSAETPKVEDLLEAVRRGEVRVPQFQRGLRWQVHHVRDLFDSILKGYPIGTLLFWRRGAGAGRTRLGPLVIDAPELDKAQWVIDGQQRLTSLAGVLLREGQAGDDPFALWLDLERQTVHGRNETIQPGWLPLHSVGDLERLLPWLAGEPDPERRRLAQRAAKAIREYQVPTYTVETEDELVAREIFRRMNTAGVDLTPDEIFQAIHGGTEADDLETLEGVANGLGFGAWDREWLLKIVLSIGGKDLSRGLAESVLANADANAYIARAAPALARVVHFLRQDAGIPHLRLLPYRLPLLALARFFDRFPDPMPRNRVLLARWLWRGAVTGVHANNGAPFVRSLNDAVGEDESTSVQALLDSAAAPQMFRVFGPTSTAIELIEQRFNAKSAASRIAAQALLALHPRDVRTGEPIDVPSLLDTHGADAFVRINEDASIRGRALHPPIGAAAFHQHVEESPDRQVARSHAIQADPERDLIDILEEVLIRRLGLEDGDRPPLSALLVADDDEEE